MICMKCGAAKYADDSLQCKCGGHFEEMRNLKWVEG
jgi:ribosomal protein L37E